MAQDRVEAVERALTVLEVFDASQEAFSLAELAQATGFYKSTLLRLLGSLARFDYVRRDDDGRWRLGDSPWRLARRQGPDRLLATRIQPVLDELAGELGETASLLERTRERIECRLVALPTTALRHDLHPGMSWPAAAPDDPRPELPGGMLVTHPLDGLPGSPVRWLALSGPSGRLSPRRAARALADAAGRLAARPGAVTQSPSQEEATS